MKISCHKEISPHKRNQLLHIWNTQYPASISFDNEDDFDNYLNQLQNSEHYLLYDDQEKIQGWAFSFQRENNTWFGILINRDFQGQNWGKHLIDQLKQNNAELYGWVITKDTYPKQDGTMYLSPKGFYEKNGFRILEKEVLLSDKINTVKIYWCKENQEQ